MTELNKTNLQKLIDVRQYYFEQTGKQLTHKRINDMLPNKSVYTVAHWFDKSQTRPIPDDTLELLSLKIEKAIKEETAKNAA